MSWFWPEGFYALLMVAVFFAATFWLELPIAVAMVFASLAGALAAGEGIPLRHLVEGEFGYLDTIMVIASAMIFMKAAQRTGFLDAFAVWIIRRFRRMPALLSLGILLLIIVASRGLSAQGFSLKCIVGKFRPECTRRTAGEFSAAQK